MRTTSAVCSVLLVPLAALMTVAVGLPAPPCLDAASCSDDITFVPAALHVAARVTAVAVPALLVGLLAPSGVRARLRRTPLS